MSNNLLSLFDTFNNSKFIGFDDLFDDLITFNTTVKESTFPPYNVYSQLVDVAGEGEENPMYLTHTFIELAVAGYNKENLTVDFNEETHILTVATKSQDSSDKEDSYECNVKFEKKYQYKGISNKNFRNVWKLSNKLKFVKCSMKDGILTIEFENELDLPKSQTIREIL